MRRRSGRAPRRAVALALAALPAAGCDPGPRYRAPRVAVPAGWTEHDATPVELARTAAAMRDWWSRFHDPTLDRLVAAAIDGNLDLRIAGQRLLAARALRDQIAGRLYPQVDATGLAGITRSSSTVEYPPLPGFDTDNRLWEYGLGVSWELDAFSRIRHSVEARQDALEADVEQRRAVLLALLAELARDYVTLRARQAQIAIADRTVAAAAKAVRLSDRLYRQGIGTTLQVAQARGELETERATRPPLDTDVARLAHAIAVLTGRPPGALEAELRRPAPLPEVPALPVALPAAVIANRPDIRRAEREYAQATARIGVAVAQLYPDVTLPLSFSPQSSMVHELFTAASLSWSLLLSASAPLYHGGSLSAQVREARADAEAARLAYARTVLRGLQEVEDRLAAYDGDAVRAAMLHRAAVDDALALERARRLYEAGLTGFLDVLTGERAAYAAQDQEAVAMLSRLVDAIGLFVAIGAGWQDIPLTAATPPVDAAARHGPARAAVLDR